MKTYETYTYKPNLTMLIVVITSYKKAMFSPLHQVLRSSHDMPLNFIKWFIPLISMLSVVCSNIVLL